MAERKFTGRTMSTITRSRVKSPKKSLGKQRLSYMDGDGFHSKKSAIKFGRGDK